MTKHTEEMFEEEIEGLISFPSQKNKDIFITRWKDRVVFDDDDLGLMMATDIYEKAKELASEKRDYRAEIDWECEESVEDMNERERKRNAEYEKDIKEIEELRRGRK